MLATKVAEHHCLLALLVALDLYKEGADRGMKWRRRK
jgi:hypothetical protein